MVSGPAVDMLQSYSHSGCQRLHITAPLGLNQNYITKLFNLIPGLEYCDLNEQTGKKTFALDLIGYPHEYLSYFC